MKHQGNTTEGMAVPWSMRSLTSFFAALPLLALCCGVEVPLVSLGAAEDIVR